MTALVTGSPRYASASAFELLERHCGDLLRGIVLAVDRHLVVGAHFALNGGNVLSGFVIAWRFAT